MAESHRYRSIFQTRTTRGSASQRSPGHTPFTRANARMMRLRPSIRMEPPSPPDLRMDTAKLRSVAAGLSDGQNALDSFVEQLEKTREGIAKELSTAISNTEDSMKTRLDKMTTKYAQKAEQLQADYTKVLGQLRVPVTGKNAAEDQPAELDSVDVFGFDRDAFLSKVEAENRSLKRLWCEWEKVQQKIVCLAVEVLGVERAGVTKNHKRRVMKKRVNRAAALFDKQQAEQGAMLGELQKQEKAITLMAEISVKALKARQKKRMDERKKQRAEVCQLAKKVIANV
ncbi:hypothetical protein MGYG_01906 [Nannizzia gypsea CBS 118893]|uniref:Uncharacterized protein n=1 Tax=Arthroderma gypseum (strain ATCC MYA-4604 / CBS 118893) TaxID=535722 RepID=E5QYM9_ARTGP|nr:hypothetical protein MGYG_01906 [Nannizzia gypsea CBS 118893]EFQ98892.1 hypothetical protein MGYG_01906 [Nannizzia gypsea CBS 118893]